MAPPGRTPCRRLNNRLVILADGRAVACDQDYKGLYPVGDLAEEDLAGVWQGEPMNRLREFLPTPDAPGDLLCGRCEEWARP